MLTPEKRPLIIAFYNRLFKIAGSGKPFHYDAFIRKARNKTGLSDFGSDFNEDALKVLLISINEEAGLHPFGKLMMREKLISQLENRLWAEHWFKKYPEILEQELLPVVLVTGLQRTGTTKMQRLLSGLPGARGLLSWEALYPAPIGTESEIEKRRRRTRRNEKAVKWISPSFHAIHPIHTDQPEEDVLLLDMQFMGTSSEAIMHVPSFADWLEKQDQTIAYAYERKLLLLLQWQRNGSYWVLKSPHHLQYLEAFIKIFPDTRIIWMHRLIESCIPSYLSMLYYSRAMFVDEVDREALKTHWLHKLEKMLDHGLAFRSKHKNTIMDVPFQYFMEKENRLLPEILEFLTISWDKKPANPVANTENGYNSNHRYHLNDWKLTANDLRARFANYTSFLESFHITA